MHSHDSHHWLVAQLARLMRLARAAAFLDGEGAQASMACAQPRAPRAYAGVLLSSLAIWVITFAWIFLCISSIVDRTTPG